MLGSKYGFGQFVVLLYMCKTQILGLGNKLGDHISVQCPINLQICLHNFQIETEKNTAVQYVCMCDQHDRPCSMIARMEDVRRATYVLSILLTNKMSHPYSRQWKVKIYVHPHMHACIRAHTCVNACTYILAFY